jgi:hypothetical protein
MRIRLFRFLVVLLAALTLTMEAAHVLELPQKMQYSVELYSAVNSTLYRYFALVGGPLTVGTLLCGAVLVAKMRNVAGFRWTLVGVCAYFLAFAAWLTLVAPVNARIASVYGTAPLSVPGLWTALRRRWEYGHAAGFVLELLGLASLVWSLLSTEATKASR